MAEAETKPTEETTPEVVKEEVVAPEEIKKTPRDDRANKKLAELDAWKPKTSTGRKVKSGEITHISEILNRGEKIIEHQIVDLLMPELETELLLVGQSKGKFGGGSRRIFNQTQKKTPEGNKLSFATLAVSGNKNGYLGLGGGKSGDTVPAREKAARNSKLNMFKIRRGCGSWQCNCKTPHSIPFTVEGKCGSVSIKLIPAPKGKGLIVEKECAKILKLAGIKDVWSKTKGQTNVKKNLIAACEQALRQLMLTKITTAVVKETGLTEGSQNE